MHNRASHQETRFRLEPAHYEQMLHELALPLTSEFESDDLAMPQRSAMSDVHAERT